MTFLEIVGAAVLWIVATKVICFLIIFIPAYITRKRELEATVITARVALFVAILSAITGLVTLGYNLASA